MSDDWQVVEEAVKFTNYSTSEAVKDKRDVALAALARLREREATLEAALRSGSLLPVQRQNLHGGMMVPGMVWAIEPEVAEAALEEK